MLQQQQLPSAPVALLRVRVVEVVCSRAQRVKVGTVRGVVGIQKATAVAAGSKGTAAAVTRRRHCRTVDVHARVLLLPLGATVLEPDLDLKEKDKEKQKSDIVKSALIELNQSQLA